MLTSQQLPPIHHPFHRPNQIPRTKRTMQLHPIILKHPTRRMSELINNRTLITQHHQTLTILIQPTRTQPPLHPKSLRQQIINSHLLILRTMRTHKTHRLMQKQHSNSLRQTQHHPPTPKNHILTHPHPIAQPSHPPIHPQLPQPNSLLRPPPRTNTRLRQILLKTHPPPSHPPPQKASPHTHPHTSALPRTPLPPHPLLSLTPALPRTPAFPRTSPQLPFTPLCPRAPLPPRTLAPPRCPRTPLPLLPLTPRCPSPPLSLTPLSLTPAHPPLPFTHPCPRTTPRTRLPPPPHPAVPHPRTPAFPRTSPQLPFTPLCPRAPAFPRTPLPPHTP